MTGRMARLMVAATVAALVAGCGGLKRGADPAGVMGTNARIGDISLLSVHVEAPPDAQYERGADARLWLTLRNDGRQIDSLVRVSTPAAARAEIRWDKDCDGTAEKVPALPLRPAGPDPVDAPSAAPVFDSYRVRLVDLTQVVRAGTTIPVKFVFQKAGQVTVETIVQPSVPRPEPSTRCVPG